MNNPQKKFLFVILTCSFVVYLISFTQESYCTTSCVYSFMAFLTGWLGVLLEAGLLIEFLIKKISGEPTSLEPIGATFTWLANPVLIAAWSLVLFFPRISLLLSLASGLISLSFLFCEKIISDEAGNYAVIQEYKWGYWLWVISSFILVAGVLIELMRRRISRFIQNRRITFYTFSSL